MKCGLFVLFCVCFLIRYQTSHQQPLHTAFILLDMHGFFQVKTSLNSVNDFKIISLIPSKQLFLINTVDCLIPNCTACILQLIYKFCPLMINAKLYIKLLLCNRGTRLKFKPMFTLKAIWNFSKQLQTIGKHTPLKLQLKINSGNITLKSWFFGWNNFLRS